MSSIPSLLTIPDPLNPVRAVQDRVQGRWHGIACQGSAIKSDGRVQGWCSDSWLIGSGRWVSCHPELSCSFTTRETWQLLFLAVTGLSLHPLAIITSGIAIIPNIIRTELCITDLLCSGR